MKATVDTAEVTAHTDSDKVYLAGHVNSEYSVAGHVDFGAIFPVDDTEIRAKLGSSGHIAVSMCMGGYTVGQPAILDYVHPTQYDIKAPNEDAVSFSATLVTGTTGNQNAFKAAKTMAGLVLFRSTALSTSTSAAASQDNGSVSTAATTRGYVAHLHAFGGTIGSTKVVSVQVQHSSAGVSWANLTSLTDINLTGSYLGASRAFSTSATVKRYVRGACVTQGSTGEPSVLLTFARR